MYRIIIVFKTKVRKRDSTSNGAEARRDEARRGGGAGWILVLVPRTGIEPVYERFATRDSTSTNTNTSRQDEAGVPGIPVRSVREARQYQYLYQY